MFKLGSIFNLVLPMDSKDNNLKYGIIYMEDLEQVDYMKESNCGVNSEPLGLKRLSLTIAFLFASYINSIWI